MEIYEKIDDTHYKLVKEEIFDIEKLKQDIINSETALESIKMIELTDDSEINEGIAEVNKKRQAEKDFIEGEIATREMELNNILGE